MHLCDSPKTVLCEHTDVGKNKIAYSGSLMSISMVYMYKLLAVVNHCFSKEVVFSIVLFQSPLSLSLIHVVNHPGHSTENTIAEKLTPCLCSGQTFSIKNRKKKETISDEIQNATDAAILYLLVHQQLFQHLLM